MILFPGGRPPGKVLILGVQYFPGCYAIVFYVKSTGFNVKCNLLRERSLVRSIDGIYEPFEGRKTFDFT